MTGIVNEIVKKHGTALLAVLLLCLVSAGCGGQSGRTQEGQLQRTALGRAVMSGASLLLMDEPFSALDLRNRARLQSFMKTFLEDTEREGDGSLSLHAFWRRRRTVPFLSCLSQVRK